MSDMKNVKCNVFPSSLYFWGFKRKYIENKNILIFYRLGNYEEAQKYFKEAWERCDSEKEQDPQYYSSISVTIKYNTARLHEMFCQFDKAEKLYKEILQDHPNYVDCKHETLFIAILLSRFVFI